MQKLQPLTIEDRGRINTYLHNFPQHISELTFTNLFVWRHSRPVWTAIIDDSLFFLIPDQTQEAPSKKIILGGPIGKTSPEKIVNKLGSQVAGAIRVPENSRQALLNAGFPLLPDRDNADYVYLVSDLAELPGRRFTKKRNHINQCLKNNSCIYETIDYTNIDECRIMQERWCRLRGCSDNMGLCDEFQAIRELFTHYEALKVTGGAIRVDGLIQAFAVAEALLPDTAVWHFEKAMPEIDGLGQLINHWFARNSLTGFTYVNREQDLGIPGLRQAKESYYPFCMIPKYSTVSPDKPE